MSGEPKTDDSRPLLPIRVVAWIGTSVGITGLLVAVGYVVYSAHAELLGFYSYTLAPADYLRFTGTFLLDTTLQLSDLAASLWSAATRSWSRATALILGTAIPAVASSFAIRRLRRLHPRVLTRSKALVKSRELSVLIVALAAVLSMAKSAVFDVPASQIDGVLLRKAECNRSWSLPKKAQDRTNRLWQDILCSREEAGNLLPACDCGLRDLHRKDLRNAFLFVASWPVLLLLPLALVARNVRSSRVSVRSGAGRGWTPLVLMTLLVGLNVISVPYFYGKTLYPTTFNIGDVALRATPEMPGSRGYFLNSDKEAVTIFDCTEKALITVPRTEILEIRVDDLGDVIVSRLGGGRMGECR